MTHANDTAKGWSLLYGCIVALSALIQDRPLKL